jgi:hypothetical protein
MSTSSSFLCLPAELCNQIYKLVLISPKLLILASKYDGRATLLLFEIDGVMREFNQLKYVNKQIFKDIKNIELSYNDIMVHRTRRSVPQLGLPHDVLDTLLAEWCYDCACGRF